MTEVALGWATEVERGPDWLFVKLTPPPESQMDARPLAESVAALLKQHFTRRLVLECDQIGVLTSTLIGQLVLLHRQIHAHGGIMRLCGLSEENQDVLHQCRLDSRFPHFGNRAEAVLGHRPLQPR